MAPDASERQALRRSPPPRPGAPLSDPGLYLACLCTRCRPPGYSSPHAPGELLLIRTAQPNCPLLREVSPRPLVRLG